MTKTAFFLILTCSIPSFASMASTSYATEVTCNSIENSGVADKGITVLLQSDPSGRQRVQVTANGALGRQLVASSPVPAEPKMNFPLVEPGKPGVVILSYDGNGLSLALLARATRNIPLPLTGQGTLYWDMPGYDDMISLKCAYGK